MSGIALVPSEWPRHAACSWCGLRLGPFTVAASPTCAECRDAGRSGRVRAYLQQLRRGAK